MSQDQTYRIENSARRGYFRVTHMGCGAVLQDELSWAAALQLQRLLLNGTPVVRAAAEDGSGDD